MSYYLTNAEIIFNSISSMCTAFILLIIPSTTIISLNRKPSLVGIYITLALWCIIIPCIMLATKATNGSISGENTFVTLKLISVIVFLLASQFFISVKYSKGSEKWNLVRTVVLLSLFAFNILEACYTQFKNYRLENRDPVDLVNVFIGIGLVLILLLNFIRGSRVLVSSGENNKLTLVSNLGIWFIICYTLWNLLFRIQLIQNTSTVIFFAVSLLLPLILHFNGNGDWLQTRGFTLLFLMIVTFGITPGDGRIFPKYNKDGYEQVIDDENIFTKLQKQEWFKYTLLILGFISMIFAFTETYLKNKRIKE